VKTLSEIEDAVLRLSPSELAAFRAWFIEYDSEAGTGKSNATSPPDDSTR
jgi:hypothetical protein